MGQRLNAGFRFAFGDLIKDIGGWLLIGIVIAGIISFFLPENFFEHHLDSEILSLVGMLVIGIPFYVCASASTPIAAALILKGLSPGAALVFLLAGPSTNAATLTVFIRYFGKKACVLYLLTIACCSLVFGWTVNRIYEVWQLSIHPWNGGATEPITHLTAVISSLLLLGLIAKNYLPESQKKTDTCECSDTV